MNGRSPRRALAGIVGSDFSDPTNERIIFLAAAGLAIVGLALLLGTIVWWRRGRQEHPSLAPLEVMGGRAWDKAPEGDRRRRLDHVRLPGAGAMQKARAEPLDLQALVRNTPYAFDDLREPGVEPEAEPAADEPVAPAAIADDAASIEPVKAADDAPSKPSTPAAPPSPAVVDPDATSISAPRPPQTIDVVAGGPSDPFL